VILFVLPLVSDVQDPNFLSYFEVEHKVWCQLLCTLKSIFPRRRQMTSSSSLQNRMGNMHCLVGSRFRPWNVNERVDRSWAEPIFPPHASSRILYVDSFSLLRMLVQEIQKWGKHLSFHPPPTRPLLGRIQFRVLFLTRLYIVGVSTLSKSGNFTNSFDTTF
jgi:hypothetical protein